jgi:hypothetical protein
MYFTQFIEITDSFRKETTTVTDRITKRSTVTTPAAVTPRQLTAGSHNLEAHAAG